MKKTNAITKQDIKKNETAIAESDSLSPDLMEKLEQNLPEFVKEYQRDGTAVIRWSYELQIIWEYILRRDFGFTEEEIENLERSFKEILPKVMSLKAKEGLIVTKVDYVGVADTMVKLNKQIGRVDEAGRKGILLPKGGIEKLK